MTKLRVSLPTTAAIAAVLLAAACGGGGAGASVCDAEPSTRPEIRVTGVPFPESGHLTVRGAIGSLAQSHGTDGSMGEFTVADRELGPVTIRWESAGDYAPTLDLDQVLEVDVWRRVGFKGAATGLRIRDEKGLLLAVDDGDYGNAILPADLAPFIVTQKDAGCRNRDNRPGSLNNFLLVVSAAGESVELIHGEQGTLTTPMASYTVVALQSTARVGDVVWTDAPYEHKAFVIARE